MFKAFCYQLILALILVITTTPALSAGVVVHDQVKFCEAVKQVGPGDVIKLANGILNEFSRLLNQ